MFFAGIIEKFAGFILSIFVVRLIAKDDYGNIAYALSIINVLKVFSGFGLNHSFLRFASIENDRNEKNRIFNYSLFNGTITTFGIIFVIYLFSKLITKNLPESRIYLNILSFQLLSLFVIQLYLNYCRVNDNNKKYSNIKNIQSLQSIILVILFTKIFKDIGYVTTLALKPLLLFIILLIIDKNINIKDFSNRINVDKKSFWKYGFFVGLGSVASQLQFSLDTLFLGQMIRNAEQIAIYKIAYSIPYQLLFIPHVFMTTDFVTISRKYKDKQYLINYYKKYLLLFIPVSIVIFIIFSNFKTQIITLLYSEKYLESAHYMSIFLIGVLFTFCIRTPMANILMAVGKAKWAMVISFIALAINSILNYFLIGRYQLLGAAYATNITLIMSGIIFLILFLFYLKRIKTINENLEKA